MNGGKFKYRKDELNFINKEFKEHCKPYDYIPAILPAKKRVIVFGDIHGDFALMIDMFTSAGLVRYLNGGGYKWIGKSTYVVQVGDQIDRCRPVNGLPCNHPNSTINDEGNDIKILDFFNEMHRQAKKKGGAVISLLGNHEILNATGFMNYVSYEGLKQFESYKDLEQPNKTFESGQEARVHAFQPGNEYGKMLGCTRLPALIIGSNIFVHAGIVDGLIKDIKLNGIDDFERINIKMRKWLIGLIDEEEVKNIIKVSEHSMFWTRILGKIPPGADLKEPECINNIKQVLNLFKVGSIIVGHTPQSFMYSNDINSTCSGRVWRVDNGSSSAFNAFDLKLKKTGVTEYSRRVQYLEIIDDVKYYKCDQYNCKCEIRVV
jgi:hypothetical protein